MPSADADTSAAASRQAEQEPLLAQESPTEQHGHALPANADWIWRKATQAARITTTLLCVCLAVACLAIGFYIMYILFHVPALLAVLQGSEPLLESASLIDMNDDAVLFAAEVQFPSWGRRVASVPFVNATVYHRGHTVGWVYASNLKVTPQQKHLSLCETFHIIDPEAMERLLIEAASSRRVTVNARTSIALSGFGKYLPVASINHEMDVALPAPPAVNTTVYDATGPVADTRRGGITAQANVKLELPALVSANISPVCLEFSYRDVTIAAAEIGPVSVDSNGTGDVPVTVNIRQIATRAHEAALADMAIMASSGEGFELVASGADPSRYDTAPRWLRRALSNITIPIQSDMLQLSRDTPLQVADIVKEVVVDKLYAYWSAQDSFEPWAGVSAQALIDIPNPSAANIIFEIESLVPRLQFIDKEQRPFATADIPTTPIQLRQTAASQFVVSCDYDRLGLRVVPGRELQFTHAIKRALSDRHIALGVAGTLDIVLNTSIGRIRIGALPVSTDIDWKFDSANATEDRSLIFAGSSDELYAGKPAVISVSRIHIVDTTRDRIMLEIDVRVDNPFAYGAFITDMALMVKYSGLHIATVGVKGLSLSQGTNDVTMYVDFNNYPNDPRQRMLFLEASSGGNVTLEIAGFPNCTSISPLEESLRNFAQTITIDTSKLGNHNHGHGAITGSFPKVLREVVFHIFAMSAEATVVNPVSGVEIWLQAIEAIGYYKDDIPLGTLEYDFTARQPGNQHQMRSNGLLLPYKQSITTPRLPIAANETSIGWDVLRRAIGGTLDVDVLTNIQMQIGNAPLNFTIMGRNAPVKVRL
ncbi:hypothetical protein IWW50_002745 [Coemansia erecta]|nr:hypothetical protein IWW50_002745 [Coemansia erecta]